MFSKSNLKVGQKLLHKYLGVVVYDEDCAYIESKSGMPDTLHVMQHGELVEVSLRCILGEE